MSEAAGEDDAVRAFAALRAEVAQLRQGIELVYRQGQEAAVDYSPTLGEMAKTLTAVQSRLAAIEGKPALGVTPQMFRQQIEDAGQWAGRAMAEGAAAQSTAVRELQVLVGQARTRKDQRGWLAFAAVGGAMAGLLLIRVLVAVLPGPGDWLAARLIGGGPWWAGQVLMDDADPAAFARMVKLDQACGDHQVEFCTAAITLDEAAKVGPRSGVETTRTAPAAGTAERR